MKVRLRAFGLHLLVGMAAWSVSMASRAEPPIDSSAATIAEVPRELVNFTPYDQNPVFTRGAEGDWDAAIRERGWILREDDSWHLWYTGYDGTREGLKMLGHATSHDGLSWVRDPRNPLVRDHWVEDMMIVPHEGTYYMFAEGRGDRAHLFTSPDGITWSRQGPLDIRYVNGTPLTPGPYGTPTAWHEDGVWYLFYERMDAGVWLARSTDLRIWTNVQDEPILVPGPEEYDGLMIALNQVICHEGRYYASYHGTGDGQKPRNWCSCVAVSDDLRTWRKYQHNPVVTDNKSSGQWVPDRGTYRLYTHHDRVDAFMPRSK